MPYKRLELKYRIIIVELEKEHHSVGEIKKLLLERHQVDCSKRGIQKIIKKYKDFGIYEDRKRSGRPVKMSLRIQRRIRRICMQNRFMSLTNITGSYNKHLQNISRSTVNNILIKYGLKSRPAIIKPLLNKKQRIRRIQWARGKEDWDHKKWASVVFSDESMFRTMSHTRRATVRCLENERLKPFCTKKMVQHCNQVHVWGCFSIFGVGMLKKIEGNLNSKKYQSEIINDVDVIGKCITFPQKNFIFQHDLAPSHNSISTKSFLTEKGIQTLDWPGNSPDVNPIENLWAIIKNKLHNCEPMTCTEMWAKIQDIWYHIPVSICRSLIDSMPRRVSAVLRMNGYPTKY